MSAAGYFSALAWRYHRCGNIDLSLRYGRLARLIFWATVRTVQS